MSGHVQNGVGLKQRWRLSDQLRSADRVENLRSDCRTCLELVFNVLLSGGVVRLVHAGISHIYSLETFKVNVFSDVVHTRIVYSLLKQGSAAGSLRLIFEFVDAVAHLWSQLIFFKIILSSD